MTRRWPKRPPAGSGSRGAPSGSAKRRGPSRRPQPRHLAVLALDAREVLRGELDHVRGQGELLDRVVEPPDPHRSVSRRPPRPRASSSGPALRSRSTGKKQAPVEGLERARPPSAHHSMPAPGQRTTVPGRTAGARLGRGRRAGRPRGRRTATTAERAPAPGSTRRPQPLDVEEQRDEHHDEEDERRPGARLRARRNSTRAAATAARTMAEARMPHHVATSPRR